MVGLPARAKAKKGDEGDARHPICFEAVRCRTDAVARVVTGAICDNAGVLRVVFRKMKDDLHEIGADVRDLGEDAAADPQGACAEGFTYGKADEAGARELLEEDQDADHEEQLDAHEEKADAHARPEGDSDYLNRSALEGGEGRPRIGARVDPHAEPCHAVGAQDPENRTKEYQDYASEGCVLQASEVVGHADGDENPEDDEELALLGEVGLAGFPDDGGHIEHGLVRRQVLRLVRLDETEEQPENAHDETEIHNIDAVQRTAEHVEADIAEIGQYDVRFTREGR